MMDYSQLIPGVRALKPSGSGNFDIAATMDDVLSLDRQPDFVTPWVVRDAGIDSLVRGRTFYTSNARADRTAHGHLRILCAHLCAFVYAGAGPGHRGRQRAIDLCLRTLLGPGDRSHHPGAVLCLLRTDYTAMRRPPGRNPDQGGKRVPAHGRRKLRAAITRTKILVLPPEQPHRRGDGREDLEAIADVLRGTNIIVLFG